jgi:hypothetical protein
VLRAILVDHEQPEELLKGRPALRQLLALVEDGLHDLLHHPHRLLTKNVDLFLLSGRLELLVPRHARKVQRTWKFLKVLFKVVCRRGMHRRVAGLIQLRNSASVVLSNSTNSFGYHSLSVSVD